jgi:hypothetical protein
MWEEPFDALRVPTLLLVTPDSDGAPAGGGAQRPGPDRCGARRQPLRAPRPARQVPPELSVSGHLQNKLSVL